MQCSSGPAHRDPPAPADFDIEALEHIKPQL